MMRAEAVDSSQLNEQGPKKSFLYDGFISYDHDDRAVAQGIQRGLHRIGRRMGRLHALRVFRDSTDLTASPDLWGEVTDAMDRSRYLIAVLSPHAAASVWVDKEVAYWLEHRGANHLMLVVAGGRLTWDAEAARSDPDGSDAAPPVLTQPGVLRSEPLYVDVSDDAPWDLGAPLFREKVTDLAAPIHGKPKYELASEDLREQRRFRRLRRAAIVGLVVLTVCALTGAAVAVVQRQEAERQRNQAETNLLAATAEKLTAQAQAILVGGQPGSEMEVINKVIAAQRISPKVDTGALFTTLVVEDRLRKVVDVSGDLSSDGRQLATNTESGVQMLDPETGEAIGKSFADSKTSWIGGLSADGRYVAMVSDDYAIRIWDSATGRPVGQRLTGKQGHIVHPGCRGHNRWPPGRRS